MKQTEQQENKKQREKTNVEPSKLKLALNSIILSNMKLNSHMKKSENLKNYAGCIENKLSSSHKLIRLAIFSNFLIT